MVQAMRNTREDAITNMVLGAIIALGVTFAVVVAYDYSKGKTYDTDTGMKVEALDHEGHEYTVFTHRESLQIQVLHNADCKKCKP